MELRDALIPAIVHRADVETETHDITGMGGVVRKMVTGRRVKMEIEVMSRNDDELNWLWQSLQENGNRICLVPDGSPIIHPCAMKSVAPESKHDQPKTLDSFW